MSNDNWTRRSFTKLAGVGGLAAVAGCSGGGGSSGGGDGAATDASGDGDTEADAGGSGSAGQINYGGIATVNAGDWSDFEGESDWDVNFVTIGNSPGDILSTMVAGGGRQNYDLLAPVGGIQPPLVEQDALQPVDTDRLDNWDGQYDFWETEQGREFVGHDGDIYGVPVVWQGDSIAYLPGEVDREITSYGALFDDEFAGQVAIEDNYTTAGQKTAMYLKANDMADIDDPRNMTESEITTVVDFLIEQKQSGQFRTLWSGFETAVSLMSEREVVVMDTWEPVVFALRSQGMEAEYATPDEGYLLWAMVDYVVNPQGERSDARTEAVYDFVDWQLSGWYGATISQQTGYMTNPAAVSYAEDTEGFDGEQVADIHEGVQRKFNEIGGSWQQRWPDNREAYEEQWQRLRNA
jgi:spermidine/putrescine-binding protein